MPSELTWRKAIEKVLSASATPLHYNEITEQIIAEGLRHSLGATPAATISAQISSSIKKDGAASPYTRVGKGIYAMAKGHGQVTFQQKPKLTPDVSESEETEAQYEASSAEFVGEIDSESPRSGVSLLKVVHNRPIREWV